MVRTAAADESARPGRRDRRGGRAGACIDEQEFAASKPGTPYLAPQVLLGVDHAMRVMREEIFGPVVGIMKVRVRRGSGRGS